MMHVNKTTSFCIHCVCLLQCVSRACSCHNSGVNAIYYSTNLQPLHKSTHSPLSSPRLIRYSRQVYKKFYYGSICVQRRHRHSNLWRVSFGVLGHLRFIDPPALCCGLMAGGGGHLQHGRKGAMHNLSALKLQKGWLSNETTYFV